MRSNLNGRYPLWNSCTIVYEQDPRVIYMLEKLREDEISLA